MLLTRGLRRLQVGPIDLALEDGACLSIMGPSGAGKSVLLRMIADLDPHDGDATLDDVACGAMSAPTWRRRVTYVAAESGWWLPRVGGHFAVGTDFATLFPQLGIPPDACSWPVDRLSTGERQRLSLLRALNRDTRVLLLDEPTSGLDESSAALVEALLARQSRAGVAIVLVTHDAVQAARVASRHLALRDGRLVEVG